MTQLVARRGTMGVAKPPSYKSIILAEPSLVSYWRLDETGIGTAADQTGRNPGSYGATGITYGAAGALTYSGDNDAAATFTNVAGSTPVTVPFNASLRSSIWTVEAWVYLTSANQSDILSNLDGIGGSGYNIFTTLSNALTIDVSQHNATSADNVISLNSWTHVVATFDGTNARGYVNGSLVIPATSLAVIAGGSKPDLIGNGCSGSIDEVAVYNTVLSAADILAHYLAAHQPVAFDSVTGAGPFVTGSLAWTHTASAAGCANGYLLVAVMESGIGATCTVTGFSPTKLCDFGSSGSIFGVPLGVVAPNTAFSILVTNFGNISAQSILYNNVAQTNSVRSPISQDSSSTDPFTTTPLSSGAPGSMVVSMFYGGLPGSVPPSPTVTSNAGTGILSLRRAVVLHWNADADYSTNASYDVAETAIENVSFTWHPGAAYNYHTVTLVLNHA